MSQRKETRKKSTRWSQRVTETSDALDIKKGVFSLHSPLKIAAVAEALRGQESPLQNRTFSVRHVDAEF